MLSDKTSNAIAGVSKATLHEGVRVKHLFRIMTHCPDLWMKGYSNIYANKGAVTEGVDQTTLDGMSRERIDQLIDALKNGTYSPKPAKRVYIPKANGKQRPLGLPSGDDKLVQEVVRMLLELIYEPIFSNHSHGFRPDRSCHTALIEISQKWKGVKWIVDMDIQGYFDNIDHQKMIDILETKIDDGKFIKLIKSFLEAGYLEDWTFHDTYSGTPQGGICSPVLANIFLHELDKHVERLTSEFNKGVKRKLNLEYDHASKRVRSLRDKFFALKKDGNLPEEMEQVKKELRAAELEKRQLPSADPWDSEYKRLHYVRYADDFVAGILGSRRDAEEVAENLKKFLGDSLKLQISETKSGIHHVAEGFNYLSYHLRRGKDFHKLVKHKCGKTKDGKNLYAVCRRGGNNLYLQAPLEKIWAFCKRKKYLSENMPTHRPELLNLSDYEIVSTFNAELRGFLNYYSLAPTDRLQYVEWAGTTSLFKTLATKHNTSSARIRRQMKKADEHVLRYQRGGQARELKVFKVKHRSLPDFRVVDREQKTSIFGKNTDIVQRLNAQQCEFCNKTEGNFEVHHVRKLKDIKAKKQKAAWEIRMCARNRKTMVLCKECHVLLHQGKLQSPRRNTSTGMESVVHGNVQAAFGGGRTSSPDLEAWVASKPISD